MTGRGRAFSQDEIGAKDRSSGFHDGVVDAVGAHEGAEFLNVDPGDGPAAVDDGVTERLEEHRFARAGRSAHDDVLVPAHPFQVAGHLGSGLLRGSRRSSGTSNPATSRALCIGGITTELLLEDNDNAPTSRGHITTGLEHYGTHVKG